MERGRENMGTNKTQAHPSFANNSDMDSNIDLFKKKANSKIHRGV